MNPTNQSGALDALVLPNVQRPSPNLVTGGAPDAATLEAAATAGVRYVLDLRPAAERSFDEPAVVAGHGMEFLHLPIAGPQELTLQNARALDGLLDRIGGAAAIVHCASGNRVGALMALREAWIKGSSAAVALENGRAHGLTKMEPAVAALLERGPA